MRFKKSPQLPGAGRTRAWHHHGSHTPTSRPVNPNILAASVIGKFMVEKITDEKLVVEKF